MPNSTSNQHGTPKAGQAEQRKHERFTAELNVRLLVLDDRAEPMFELHGYSIDIALGGMAVLVPEPVPRERNVVLVVLDADPAKAPRLLFAQTRSCNRVDSEWIRIGLQFHELPREIKSKSWFAAVERSNGLAPASTPLR
jgi:c-di-GMP-binding flagellar brake protein YcgR